MEDEHQEKYVIFIDVLGWSSLVSGKNQDLVTARKVANELAVAFQEGTARARETDHWATPKFEFFSDSIIVTIPFIGGETYWPEEVVFSTCRRIATAIMPHGLLVRGGISRGPIIHDDKENICFGPALVSAYELESKVAIYPRIVIDPKLVDFLESHDALLAVQAEKGGTERAKSIRKMDDGVAFADYLAPRHLESGKVSADEKTQFETTMRLAKQISNRGRRRTNPSIQQKYEWYRAYTRSVEYDYAIKRIR